ncbi:MAG TPA: hypothetical protein VJ124_12215 [Pyrinomonadaceae bacterium]|nr:hypothetical protein [Pyrinomonadaceae bacterium]
MFQRLTTADSVETARKQIAALFANHAEWFYSTEDGTTQALRRSEVGVDVLQGRLILSCWTEAGTRSWRIRGWKRQGEKLLFAASRRMGADQPLVELVPRASAATIAATVRAGRQTRCEQLARLASSHLIGAKIERVALSRGARHGQPGRYARIILRLKHQRIAVTGIVASHGAHEVDAFLSAALLWFARTSERSRPPYIQQLWLIVEREMTMPAAQRVALLRESLKEAIRVSEIDEAWTQLEPVPCPERCELWKKRLRPLKTAVRIELSVASTTILSQAPEAIDVVQAGHGETLRYFGLPFARVRRLLETERVWFGIDGARRRMREESSEREWKELLDELRNRRAADASDRHHALYRMASEAWLESLLRRDICKLDPGLVVAPLYAQFRTSRGVRLTVRPVDLLAIRRDGRLVVIELKVFEDREHVLQGVDYWYRVEQHRRRGHIARAKLFGARRIMDQAPLIYLVAPTLRIHPSFRTLARMIAPDIEIYRFDINEDWRAGVRVMRRTRVN